MFTMRFQRGSFIRTKYQELKTSTTGELLVISLSINDTSANNVFKGLVRTQCDAGTRSSLSPCQVLRMSGETCSSYFQNEFYNY